MHNEFMAFVTDEETRSTVRLWADRQGFPSDAVQQGGADLFISLLESDAPPKIAFVDFDNQLQPAQTASRLAGLCGANTKLVALGTANDVSLYRSMLTAGFVDYLAKPLTPELLTQAMTLAMRGRTPDAGAAKETRIIVVIGTRGGVGASTTATNVAWLIAHELKLKCALLDLDLQFGTSALAFDLEPGHGLREILSSPQRVDSLMVAGAMVAESDRLSVLSAEESIEDGVHIDQSAVAMLLKELRTNFRAIVVDIPRHAISSQKRLFTQAHDIVLVTEMSLAGIRDTLRVRTAIKALGVTARETLVAARVGPQRSGGIDEAAFAKGAQAKINFIVPDDPKNVPAASNTGKMLGAIAKGAPITKILSQLARHLMSAVLDGDSKKKTAEGKGLLGGFLSKRKPSAKDGAA